MKFFSIIVLVLTSGYNNLLYAQLDNNQKAQNQPLETPDLQSRQHTDLVAQLNEQQWPARTAHIQVDNNNINGTGIAQKIDTVENS